MTTAPDPEPATTCCGEGGTHAPKRGEPLITSCMLCPKSGPDRYWRGAAAPPAPIIYIALPGLEDLETVARLLMTAGAQITAQRREFAISGPLTPVQAAAAWDVAAHWDSGRQIGARVEPPMELEDALLLMCPQGWDEVDTDEEEGYALTPDQWWREQMAQQAAMRKQG